MAARTTRHAATKGRSVVKQKSRLSNDAQSSKQARVIGMLQAPGGTTVRKIAVATGWQEHSVRGLNRLISGGLSQQRLKLGESILDRIEVGAVGQQVVATTMRWRRVEFSRRVRYF